MSTLTERLLEIMDARRWTRADLVAHSGMSSSVVSQWMGRGSKEIKRIGDLRAALALEAASGFRALWIAEGEGPKYVEHPPAPDPALADYARIRRVRFALSASASGFGLDELPEEDALPISFRRDWLASRHLDPDRLFAVEVANGSMEPGLWAGDTVVVNQADTELRDGEVYAVDYEGELVIKRLVRDDGRWWLQSDNPDRARYPRKAVTDDTRLIGRVVHKQSEHV